MNNINLTYVISTKNKFFYLPFVINKLLENIQTDEEIVVVDGNSTDGAKEYLADLYERKLIHKFISEPDFCQSHGCNKSLLLASGKLIKIVNDDDVIYYEGIRKCKEFMLQHPEIDVLGIEGVGANFALQNPFGSGEPSFLNLNNFKKWKNEKIPFGFSDLGLMIRKSSLPYLGLFNPNFMWTDAEYTFRITALPKVRIAWYSGLCWVRTSNELSITTRYPEHLREEMEKLEYLYLGRKKLKFDKIKKIIKVIINHKPKFVHFTGDKQDWGEVCEKSENWLKEMNRKNSAEFFY
jgi:glycosyltransferase involved in cell wall biosynthesis